MIKEVECTQKEMSLQQELSNEIGRIIKKKKVKGIISFVVIEDRGVMAMTNFDDGDVSFNDLKSIIAALTAKNLEMQEILLNKASEIYDGKMH